MRGLNEFSQEVEIERTIMSSPPQLQTPPPLPPPPTTAAAPSPPPPPPPLDGGALMDWVLHHPLPTTLPTDFLEDASSTGANLDEEEEKQKKERARR